MCDSKRMEHFESIIPNRGTLFIKIAENVMALSNGMASNMMKLLKFNSSIQL